MYRTEFVTIRSSLTAHTTSTHLERVNPPRLNDLLPVRGGTGDFQGPLVGEGPASNSLTRQVEITPESEMPPSRKLNDRSRWSPSLKIMKAFARKLLDRLHLSRLARDLLSRLRYYLSFSVRADNARFVEQGSPDRLPLPTSQMVYLVTGQYRVQGFYENGVLGANCIREALGRAGRRLEDFNAILDFGCGCGRILRHWSSLNGVVVHGTDRNPRLVAWCREAFPFARFSVTRPDQPLDYPDATVDFVCAISVFTHLTRTAQRFWMSELRRILVPGGLLYLTTCGSSRVRNLARTELKRFEAGDCVVLGRHFSGENVCIAYHPEQYVRNVLAEGWRVLFFEREGAKDAAQDLYLLQKPGVGSTIT